MRSPVEPEEEVQVRPPEPQAWALLVLEQRGGCLCSRGSGSQPLSPEPALEPKPESPPRQ